jgi:hypothetical protein
MNASHLSFSALALATFTRMVWLRIASTSLPRAIICRRPSARSFSTNGGTRPADINLAGHHFHGPAHAQSPIPVTVDNFVRAESDLYMSNMVKEGGLGQFHHRRRSGDDAAGL